MDTTRRIAINGLRFADRLNNHLIVGQTRHGREFRYWLETAGNPFEAGKPIAHIQTSRHAGEYAFVFAGSVDLLHAAAITLQSGTCETKLNYLLASAILRATMVR